MLGQPARAVTDRVLAAAALLALFVVVLIDIEGPGFDVLDFRAFYCAGQTLVQGRDPYLTEPLRTCEADVLAEERRAPLPGLAVPAPLPPYALASFALLSKLDFKITRMIFALASFAALAGTAVLLAKLARMPLAAVVAALALGDGYSSLELGQLGPIELFAIVAAAFAFSRGRYALAAIFVAVTTAEPHVAAPLAIALFAASRPTRVALAACIGALLALSLIVAGLATNVEYIARVLPAHARSELTSAAQLSLTTLLVNLGAAREVALALGTAQYLAIAALAVIVALRLAARYEAPEFVVLVPPAFVVLGGPFVHETQAAVALPMLFALRFRAPAMRVACGVAAVLIALPWQGLAENASLFVVVTAAVAFGTATAFWPGRLREPLAAAAVAVALAGLVQRLSSGDATPNGYPVAAVAAAGSPDSLAEASWTVFTSGSMHASTLHFLALHALTWTGLGVANAAAAIAARNVRGGAGASVATTPGT